jgi:hypothetical protein
MMRASSHKSILPFRQWCFVVKYMTLVDSMKSHSIVALNPKKKRFMHSLKRFMHSFLTCYRGMPTYTNV